MKDFLIKNNLPLMTLLGVGVALSVLLNWSAMPVMQRLVGLYFLGVVLHLWEEGRFPGGFTQMITRKLNFTQINPHFGEIVTDVLVLLTVFLPFFFPHVPFMLMIPMLLGFVEAFAHLAAIRMFDLKRPYSPGLVTALFVLLPMSIYGLTYASRHDLMTPLSWLYTALTLFAGLLIAQRLVVNTSGMSYREFLGRVRGALLGR